jgi:hypothetical protein
MRQRNGFFVFFFSASFLNHDQRLERLHALLRSRDARLILAHFSSVPQKRSIHWAIVSENRGKYKAIYDISCFSPDRL